MLSLSVMFFFFQTIATPRFTWDVVFFVKKLDEKIKGNWNWNPFSSSIYVLRAWKINPGQLGFVQLLGRIYDKYWSYMVSSLRFSWEPAYNCNCYILYAFFCPFPPIKQSITKIDGEQPLLSHVVSKLYNIFSNFFPNMWDITRKWRIFNNSEEKEERNWPWSVVSGKLTFRWATHYQS